MGTSHSPSAGFSRVALGAVLAALALVIVAGAPARGTAQATWRSHYDWPNGDGYAGWHSATTAPDDYGLAPALAGRPGLWLWTLGGKKTYDTADGAEWTYTAPGTTRIQDVQLAYAWNNKLLAHHCIDIGLRDASGAVVTRQVICKPPPQSPAGLTLSDPGASSQVLYFRIRVDCGGEASCSRTIPTATPPAAGSSWARLLEVDMTLTDTDQPTLSPAGALFDLRDTYIDGKQTYGATVHADDAGSGVAQAGLDRNGFGDPSGTLSTQDAPCDPHHHTASLDARICPPSFEYATTVDTTTLAEGTSHFVETARDYAGNVGTSDEWKVFVDRTPPGVPLNLNLVSFSSGTGTAVVGWDASDDPNLPDDVPGSGVSHYDVRYQLNGGDWTGPASDSDVTFAVDGAHADDVLAVEVRAVDAVGNVSEPATESFTLPEDEPSLSATDVATADDVATGDSRVSDLIGGRPYTITDTTPATGDGGVEASVSIAWSDPATITADWPSPDVVANYTAENVTGLTVTVSLGCGQVTSIEPDENSYAANDPTFVSEGTGVCGIPSMSRMLSSAFAAKAAAVSTATWVHNLRPIHVGPDVFYNYDFTHPSLTAELDWPIDLIFWNSALTPNQVKLFDLGGSIADPAYMNIEQGNGFVWDTDQGSKSGIPACNTVMHYRVYKDDNAASAHFSTNWGFYIIASSHFDRFEECKVFDPLCLCLKPVGDHWSGKSEHAEPQIAAVAAGRWGASAIQPNFVQLYNAETDHREGSNNHKWYINNGKATKIRVCIDRLGHNTLCS